MHIILLILKIIGWILLILLGLIVLLVCLVLFTPFRYRVHAACDGELSSLSARADFSLFFHVVRGSVRYIGQQLSWEVYLAWKRIGSEAEPEQGKEKEEPPAAEKLPEEKRLHEEEKPPEEEKPSEEEKTPAEEVLVEEESPAEEVSSASEETSVQKEPSVTGDMPAVQEKQEQTARKEKKSEKQKEQKKEKKSFEKKEKEPLGSKLSTIAEKIKCTCREICDKIKELLRKKEILVEFLTNDSHKAAWNKLLAEAKKLLRRLKPKKFDADIRFGFEDPSVTGKVLAGISMIYPMICEHAEIYPDFSQKILQGNVFLKGHVRVAPFAAMLWNMLLNPHVRRTVIDIKNLKF